MQTFNITEIYVDKDEPWSGILDAVEFPLHSTQNRLKVYSMVKLLFGRNMILLIKHKVDWELICQKKQAKINKDKIRKFKTS